jgi:hypothetical protein
MGRGGNVIGFVPWLLGVFILAGVSGGPGRFLWAAWTTAGVALLLRDRDAGVRPLALVGLALAGLLGVLWIAARQGSALAGWAADMGVIFWGALVGAVAAWALKTGGRPPW